MTVVSDKLFLIHPPSKNVESAHALYLSHTCAMTGAASTPLVTTSHTGTFNPREATETEGAGKLSVWLEPLDIRACLNNPNDCEN